MRSKEVEKAIDFVKFYKEHCLNIENSNIENYETINDEEFIYKNLDTVLNYISELEEENKKISDELIEEKQLNIKYLKIREEKENIIKKISLEAQKYFDMLMEVEYGRDTLPKQMIRDKIKELEEERKEIESSPYDKWDLYKVIGKIQVLKEILGE